MHSKKLLSLSAAFLAFSLTSSLSFAVDDHDLEDDAHTAHIRPPKANYSILAQPLSESSRVTRHFDILENQLSRGAANSPLRVKIDSLSNFTSSLRSRVYETRRILDEIFESEEFYEAIMNHSYNGRRTFVDNKGYSNKEVYEFIMSGKEKFSNHIDRMMNLKLKLYYENSKTVGWTYTNSEVIHVNEKFYKNYTPSKIARNLMHEWLHNMGFSHDAKLTSARNYSVPYGVGNIVQRLARKLE